MVLHRLRRWYEFRFGVGRDMRERGAEVAPCPHCGRDTPVYPSEYDRDGDPVTFTVCLWCEGLIEYGSGSPVVPFAPDEERHRSDDLRSPRR